MATQSDPVSDDETEVIPTVKELKFLAHDLFEQIKKSTLTPDGFGKLKRKVLKEIQHLQTLDENITYNSSNIHYLNGIWQTILNESNNVCGIFKKFKYISEIANGNNISYKKSELIVDIVCDDGLRWIKVKTSNPYSMQMQFMNSSSSSKGKNIITMAMNFIRASNEHKVYFQAPKIEFVFIEGITSDLAYILKQKEIKIKGKEIKEDYLYVDEDEEEEDEEDEEEEEIEIKDNDNDSLDESCVNLGVRTMLTMISALSNNDINEDFFDELQDSLHEKQQEIINNDKKDKKYITKTKKSSIINLDFEYCDYPNSPQINGKDTGHRNGYKRRKRFSEKSYEEQKMLFQMYLDEKQQPVLPPISKCLENKKLICCQSAWNHFMDIVNLSAGKNEWERCHQLKKKINIVKDEISERTKQLNGKSMSDINKCVFGTGDSLKIMTLTAIASFVRKAEQQGVKYFVHIHPVRPLTERYQTEYEKKRNEQLIKQEINNDNDGNNIINHNHNDNNDEIEVIEEIIEEIEVIEEDINDKDNQNLLIVD